MIRVEYIEDWKGIVERTDLTPVGRALPYTRGGCPEFRPCPFVSCRHHLWCDVKHGEVKITYPVEPDQLNETCSLDIADNGCHEWWVIGDALNLTRERVRQIVDEVRCKLTKRGFGGDEIDSIFKQR